MPCRVSTSGFDLWACKLDQALGRFLATDTVQPNARGLQSYNLYNYLTTSTTHMRAINTGKGSSVYRGYQHCRKRSIVAKGW